MDPFSALLMIGASVGGALFSSQQQRQALSRQQSQLNAAARGQRAIRAGAGFLSFLDGDVLGGGKKNRGNSVMQMAKTLGGGR
jgi:hypothetical protein